VFNLPAFPDVYNTRHITCVSCKEKFTVTEGHEAKNPDDSEWRVRPNIPSTVTLHYEYNRQQRSVTPTSHQTPLPPENRINARQPFTFTPYPINCPRCGVDNRNWLSLFQTDNLSSWQRWQQRFPSVRLASHVTWSFVALALVMVFLMDVHPGKAAILLATIPAAVFGVIWELTREWNELRENKHARKVIPKAKNKEAELWLRGGILIFLFTIVFPVIFFSLTPASFRLFLEFTEDSPESEVETAVTAVTDNMNQQIEATQEEFANIAGEMQKLIDDLPSDDIPRFEAEADELSNKLANTVATSVMTLEQLQAENDAAIQARRTEELAAVTKARNRAIDGLQDGLVASLGFLALWGVVVGTPTLVAVLIGMAAVKQFVNRVDQQLPPPVYFSVANMTRLVTWEARQALEIGNQHFDIQWMSVDRNDAGGLDLVGLFRDPPEFDMHGQVRSPLVRAQRHTIHTDKWGRVSEAIIEDVTVPIPAGAPAGAFQMATQSQHDAPANVRIRLPER
jgi:Skp family chaperone for outer membrane proteins